MGGGGFRVWCVVSGVERGVGLDVRLSRILGVGSRFLVQLASYSLNPYKP